MHVELVRADGRSDTVTANPGKPILDAAERASVTIPYGCRTGACSTCTGKLRVGKVEHVRPHERSKITSFERVSY